jgi:aspartate racemase
MKTLGLIGGLSWESTALYYRALNEAVRRRLGGLSSARLLVWSFDFDPIAKLMAEGDWDRIAGLMVDAAQCLETAGAEALLICSNSMHKVAPEIERAVDVPLLHIADAAAEAILSAGCSRPLLLATQFVMEEDFYKGRFRERHGLEAAIPAAPDRSALHRIIFEELCRGVVSEASKAEMLRIVAAARRDRGIDGVILGCTEFGLLLSEDDLDIPVFDTARLHAEAAVRVALEPQQDRP